MMRMSFSSTQVNNTCNIIRSAEETIKTETGMNVTLLICPNETRKSPEQMLRIIAATLGMDYEDFKTRSRRRVIVDMRFIAALLLRKNYEELTLKDIGSYFGGQDHSSIIHALERAQYMLRMKEPIFLKKYITVLNTITQWLKEK